MEAVEAWQGHEQQKQKEAQDFEQTRQDSPSDAFSDRASRLSAADETQ
jgi:hypothetical protein